MMIPTAVNPVIKTAISDILIRETFGDSQTCFDCDDVVYRIEGNEDEKCVRFSYLGNDSDNIMKNGGEEMLKELYADYNDAAAEGFHVTLKVQGGNLPKTTKIKKSMSEDEQEKTREENEIIRQQRKDMINPIAEKIAKFKMNFLSAPIRRAMNAAIAKKQLPPVEIKYRGTEKYWVLMPENNTVQVYYGVHLSNQTDISLARTMMLEWADSMKKINAPPIVKFSDKDAPDDLVKAFPHVKKEQYSNSFISFKLTEHLHLKDKDLEQSLSFLINFRTFMNYHLHAIKQSLHSRMRKRVETFERVLQNARRDKEGPKNWKETHGGI
jgi:hypothetical protein